MRDKIAVENVKETATAAEPQVITMITGYYQPGLGVSKGYLAVTLQKGTASLLPRRSHELSHHGQNTRVAKANEHSKLQSALGVGRLALLRQQGLA